MVLDSQAALAAIKLGTLVIHKGSGTKRLIGGTAQGLQVVGD
jgi:hypothetical protein